MKPGGEACLRAKKARLAKEAEVEDRRRAKRRKTVEEKAASRKALESWAFARSKTRDFARETEPKTREDHSPEMESSFPSLRKAVYRRLKVFFLAMSREVLRRKDRLLGCG